MHSPCPNNSIGVNVQRLLILRIIQYCSLFCGWRNTGNIICQHVYYSTFRYKTITAKSATYFRFLSMPFLQVFNLCKEKQTKDRMSVPYHFDSFFNTTSGTQLRSTKDTRPLTVHMKLHLCV